jgi:uncharacterized membrane protein YsdA (DUF1294 family)
MLREALVAYAALSLAAFLAYGWDKRRARTGGRRVPERTLHMLALLGGFPGAFAGMRVFRHKTRKVLFLAVLVLAAGLHAALWWWFRTRGAA